MELAVYTDRCKVLRLKSVYLLVLLEEECSQREIELQMGPTLS